MDEVDLEVFETYVVFLTGEDLSGEDLYREVFFFPPIVKIKNKKIF